MDKGVKNCRCYQSWREVWLVYLNCACFPRTKRKRWKCMHNRINWSMKSQFGQLGKGLSFFFQSNSSMDREIHVMNDLVNLGHASWSDSVRNAHGAWIINWERNPYILSENMTDKPSTWLWRKFSLKKFTTSILKEFLLYKFITKILKEIFV